MQVGIAGQDLRFDGLFAGGVEVGWGIRQRAIDKAVAFVTERRFTLPLAGSSTPPGLSDG